MPVNNQKTKQLLITMNNIRKKSTSKRKKCAQVQTRMINIEQKKERKKGRKE